MNSLYIILPLIALFGIWLVYYSRRRSRMMKDFAHHKGLFYTREDDGSLEQQLNSNLTQDARFSRTFHRVRDVVGEADVKMFQVIESLDVSYFGPPKNSYFNRIAITRQTSKDTRLFFRISEALEAHPIFVEDESRVKSDPIFISITEIVARNPPPAPLSITVMGGQFLAYFEPDISGSEDSDDLAYLYDLANEVKWVL